jgi:hypothetical protein
MTRASTERIQNADNSLPKANIKGRHQQVTTLYEKSM